MQRRIITFALNTNKNEVNQSNELKLFAEVIWFQNEKFYLQNATNEKKSIFFVKRYISFDY